MNRITPYTQNLRLMGTHVKSEGVLDARRFRICKNDKGDLILKTVGLVRRILLAPYYNSKRHIDQVKSLTDHVICYIKELDRKIIVQNPDFVAAAQRYNQSITNQNNQSITNQISTNVGQKFFEIKLEKAKNQEIVEIEPLELRKIKPIDPSAKQIHDLPIVTKEKRFFKKHSTRRYPTDLGIDHEKEAKEIFKKTQREKLLDLVGLVLRALGFKAESFEKYRYSTIGEKDNIYSTDAPISISGVSPEIRADERLPGPKSYWLGHATCLMEIPLRSENDPTKMASLRVITDPVEGDLAKVFYERQTKFAKPMEEIPAPHVYLLSHNHLDHYSKPTIMKLLGQQPIMVVPKGDGYRYQEMGFKNVQELDWWEGVNLKFKQGDEKYSMTIQAVPARHWAGQGPCGGHSSTFLGYLIKGHEEGSIYFAGDTAPLDYSRERGAKLDAKQIEDLKAHAVKYDSKVKKVEQRIKNSNNVSQRQIDVWNTKLDNYKGEADQARNLMASGDLEEYSHIEMLRKLAPNYYFAPGGPDEERVNMETTHQSSAYGLMAHVEIMLMGIDRENLSKEEFLTRAEKKKTVYMHTMTYKLGNLKLMDTPESLEKVLIALRMGLNKINNYENVVNSQLEKLAIEKYPLPNNLSESKISKVKLQRKKFTDKMKDEITCKVTAEIRPKRANNLQTWKHGIKGYELDIAKKLAMNANVLKFKDGSSLSCGELADLLYSTVAVPKIGSNIDLAKSFNQQDSKMIF